MRHNHLRNITASLLNEVCKDVMVEPPLQTLTAENFEKAVKSSDEEGHLDIRARGFWKSGQLALFDVRAFNPTAKRYKKQELSKSYEINEKEKKRRHNNRILEVEHGSFTPLVFSATGGMGRETKKFYSRLAAIIAEKGQAKQHIITIWI